MPKRKRRRTKRKSTQESRGGKKINTSLIVISIIGAMFVVFLVYSALSLFSINTKDPLGENLSSHRFLSNLDTNLEKTMFVFEQGEGEDRTISSVYVLLTNKEKGNSIVVYMPGFVYFNGLEEDFGSPIPISSLRYAGEFLQEGMGVDYSLWQINQILGFRVHDYIWFTAEAGQTLNEVYGSWDNIKDKYKEAYSNSGVTLTDSYLKLHAISAQQSFIKTVLRVNTLKEMDQKVLSNLSFTSVLNRLDSFEKTVVGTNTLVLDLSSPDYSSEELSDLGGQIRTINLSEYDKNLRRNYIDVIDREVERERVRVEVYNGSSASGKAGIYARKILNNGCDVVRFGNTPEPLERTQVYISDESEFDDSLKVVAEVLFDRYEILEERPSFMTTGDIVVLLGADILQMEMF
ncbi:MAG: coiled-coil [candidate division WS6 bacterium 36_33]|uniref:Coiled-coil n=1 Tax=candidate division WS6 bacterium 36_33 TaxID=1641388 RepID=A0A101GYK0_9BACT|nr:MAG: coiled-coil [candidate division WS6 bacterium 36_33]